MATSTSNLARLQTGSLVLAVLATIQLILGALISFNVGGEVLHGAHAGVGYLLLIGSAVTAFFAYRYGRNHDQMGRFGHAMSIPVLCVIQIGLAEGGLRTVHIIVGILTVGAIISLYTIMRKATDSD